MNPRYRDAVVWLCLFAVGVTGRLLSWKLHWWNFTPVAGLALFAGFYFRRTSVAILAPVGVMALTNLVIGGYPHWGVEAAVYAALLIPVLLRPIVRASTTFTSVVGCTVLSSVMFFLMTNFAHWYFTKPHTLDEMTVSFVNALPFFRMTLAGDLLFAGLFFGGHVLAMKLAASAARRDARPVVIKVTTAADYETAVRPRGN